MSCVCRDSCHSALPVLQRMPSGHLCSLIHSRLEEVPWKLLLNANGKLRSLDCASINANKKWKGGGKKGLFSSPLIPRYMFISPLFLWMSQAAHHYPTLHTLSKFVSVKALSSTQAGWLRFWHSRSCCSCCAGDEARCSSTSSCMRMLFPLFNTRGGVSAGFISKLWLSKKNWVCILRTFMLLFHCVSPVHMTELGMCSHMDKQGWNSFQALVGGSF